MCRMDEFLGVETVKAPGKRAWKFFDFLTKDRAYFWKVQGSIPRGKWVRFDDRTIAGGSHCETWENGFHCFPSKVKSADDFAYLTGVWCRVKGKVKKAIQFEEPLLIAEWIYVPTEEELQSAQNQ